MNEAPDFVLFLGRFHPLVVHLPIGFLIFAFLLELLGRKKRIEATTSAIPLALFLGFASSVIACILGYMLSLSGDYDAMALDIHFWFGIATTAITLLAWLIRIEKIKFKKKTRVKANISALTLIVILLSATGHYGGNLTHGSDYLTKYAPFNKKEKKQLAKIEKVEDAVVFDYLAQPILDNKCASCHNESKKKGGLSFQDSLAIFKGGKNGDALIAGNALESEMIKRVLLNPEHDDFMPPEGKTPLTEEEIAILTYWIDHANADFSSKISNVETSEDILHIASNMLGFKGTHRKGDTDLPEVSLVSDDVLSAIKAEGFVLKELVFDSGLYEVVLPANTISEINAETLDNKLDKLSQIKNNVIWLYLENNQLQDYHLNLINTFENLQKLVIDKNKITDAGIDELANHESINSLNVYHTDITKLSLLTFSKMKNLQKVYAWKTAIKEPDLEVFTTESDLEIVLGD
ncbi:c-type cytochrome domain-containing protein [uncultured Algibacter sp.]|uniref:c-type cytochrome domain-containing protein n=1 Tax=uncultured Algibacter sp. TaxID=298659 RepID=UPI002626D507|nr:c-type cytochrome domain-containing protein [uncultured Algibacter sp.]